VKLSKLYKEFFESEKSGGILLIICAILSISLANSAFQEPYTHFWHTKFLGLSLEHYINDGLMAIFFLLIGLELEREIYTGELSNLKKASLPLFGALGGMLIPAAIFLYFNYNTPTQSGAGIPMATDIAFALGILSLLGNKIPLSLKIFLTALAVIDDLGAIIIIAFFYTSELVLLNFGIALGIFALLLLLNRLKIYSLFPYLIGGFAMWYFMLQSGVHATITGVLLAFAIPFGKGDAKSPSYILQHRLHKPVAFLILPIFALANTAIILGSQWTESFSQPQNIGIITGLVLGKPLGISLFCWLAVLFNFSALPADIKWKNIIGAGLLGGIGFTMSIFITLLAFDRPEVINSSKLAILSASLVSGIVGFIWLKYSSKK
jgi:Na+:H+ antiporter, NhaA family